jgi:hypothetical protein
MMFVATNFPTASKLYHLGIYQYTDINGLFYSDNSFGVGLAFYTGIFASKCECHIAVNIVKKITILFIILNHLKISTVCVTISFFNMCSNSKYWKLENDVIVEILTVLR